MVSGVFLSTANEMDTVLSIASGIKGEVFERNWYHESHMSNASCDTYDQSKGKDFKRKEKCQFYAMVWSIGKVKHVTKFSLILS